MVKKNLHLMDSFMFLTKQAKLTSWNFCIVSKKKKLVQSTAPYKKVLDLISWHQKRQCQNASILFLVPANLIPVFAFDVALVLTAVTVLELLNICPRCLVSDFCAQSFHSNRSLNWFSTNRSIRFIDGILG